MTTTVKPIDENRQTDENKVVSDLYTVRGTIRVLYVLIPVIRGREFHLWESLPSSVYSVHH